MSIPSPMFVDYSTTFTLSYVIRSSILTQICVGIIVIHTILTVTLLFIQKMEGFPSILPNVSPLGNSIYRAFPLGNTSSGQT
jgi:hypothetical protein